ncbi:hypothetical protein DMN77_13950 [Paenibacillus sp. 79R4]|uniref:hypothetical protein n=1 Tax=Paenibacillus sp. 79R4 TaxID=2212847 RepID=UPI0015B7A47A|nr:hypothetical protein [Paenibacillus sp. 79R4]NWL88671.1 hypothetical protein [Paenibacillus sp. 79R4]
MNNYVCSNCFRDTGIIDFINENGKLEYRKECIFCKSLNTYWIEMKLIGQYLYQQMSKNMRLLSNDTWDEEKGVYIHKDMGWHIRTESIFGILEDFSVFNNFGYEQRLELAKKIFCEYDLNIDVFSDFCSKYTDDEQYQSCLRFTWDRFSENVKYYGRFNNRSNYETLQQYDELLDSFTTTINNKLMYRVRLNVGTLKDIKLEKF